MYIRDGFRSANNHTIVLPLYFNSVLQFGWVFRVIDYVNSLNSSEYSMPSSVAPGGLAWLATIPCG